MGKFENFKNWVTGTTVLAYLTKEESEKGLHLWMMESVSANMIELPDGMWEARKKELNDYLIELSKKYNVVGRFDFKGGRILP